MPKLRKPKVMKVERFTLSKTYRAMAWELNKGYDEVKQNKIANNTIKLFENTLENFYERNNLKVANKHHISLQKQMNKEQAEELAEIVDAFVEKAINDRSFFSDDILSKLTPEEQRILFDKQQDEIYDEFFEDDYEADFLYEEVNIPWDEFNVDKYEQIKEKYGVDDIQQFINWTDEMERYRANAFLSEVLSSDQIAELFAYAQSGDNKISRRALHMMIRTNYNKTGKTNYDLYNIVVNRIKAKKAKK